MARLYFTLFALAAAALSATALRADDEAAEKDQELARSIVGQLREKQKSGELEGFNLGVRADDGDVWIEGTAADEEQRQTVLETARRVPGVKQVVNAINTQRPKPSSDGPVGSPPPQDAGPVPAKQPVVAAAPRPARPAMPPSLYQLRHTVPSCTSMHDRDATADAVVESLRSRNEAGELCGFDITVQGWVVPSIFLNGEVVDESTRARVLDIVRRHPEVHHVTDQLQIAEEGKELADRVIRVSAAQGPMSKRTTLDWDDGWWQLDFKSKRHY